jgi:hypothetical protein
MPLSIISSRGLFVLLTSLWSVIVRIVVRIIRMMMVVVVMMVMVMIIGALVIIVVMMVMVWIVVVPILRQFHVWVPLGFRLGACGVRGVNGLQQSGGIWDWLKELRIRPGVHDFYHVLRG